MDIGRVIEELGGFVEMMFTEPGASPIAPKVIVMNCVLRTDPDRAPPIRAFLTPPNRAGTSTLVSVVVTLDGYAVVPRAVLEHHGIDPSDLLRDDVAYIRVNKP